MAPSNPKEYCRHLVVFNFFRQDALRLLFWHGDRATDRTGLLTGTYADGRRLATISTKDELWHTSALHAALKAQLARIHE